MLAYFGWELMVENEFQESLTIGISMLYIYALLPLSMGLLALASLGRLINIICGIRHATDRTPGEYQ